MPTNISDKDKISVSRGTVTVACRVPNGLILRLFDMVDADERTLGGVIKQIKEPRIRDCPSVTVKGPGASAFGIATPHKVVCGYGKTPGVDAGFFAEWLHQNRNADYVKNKQIWADENEDNVDSFAKENVERRSGMEPIVPANEPKEKGDPRRPRPPSQFISPVVTGTGMS